MAGSCRGLGSAGGIWGVSAAQRGSQAALQGCTGGQQPLGPFPNPIPHPLPHLHPISIPFSILFPFPFPSPFHPDSLLHPSCLSPSPVHHHSLPATILISSPFPSSSQLRHPLTDPLLHGHGWQHLPIPFTQRCSIVVSFGSVLQCRCCSPVTSTQPSWVLLSPVLGSPL